MTRVARSIALLLAIAAVAGCGLKGPLYIATPEEQAREAERQRLLREREERERAAKAAEAQQQSQPAASPQQ